MTINRFICIGRFSKELELKHTPNGKSVCSATIAINRNFKDQNGETKADFLPVVMWGNTAEKTVQYCKKGSLVGIDGRIETRSYEGQNGRVYITEIIADSVQFLETKQQEDKPKQNESISYYNQFTNQNRKVDITEDDPFANMGGKIDISIDDLPF